MTDPQELQTANQEDTEIATDDLIIALENKIGTRNFVILYSKLQPSKKIGLLGEHSTLTITYLDADGNEQIQVFFVKLMPKMAKQAEFAEGIGAFKKEIFVYEILNKFKDMENELISNIAPRCHCSRFNKYLILDNIVDEGYEPIDKKKTLGYETVLIVLQSLARLHAASIIYEEKELCKSLLALYEEDLEESFFNDRENFANEIGIKSSIVGVLKEIEIFEFEPDLICGKKFATTAEEVCYRIYELVKPSKKFRNVLSHGDLWATNFLLKFDSKSKVPIGCKFVDYQCGRYVPPAQDVLSILYLNTTREFRQKYMYQLIGMYYSYLEKHLRFAGLAIDNILPFSEFIDSCEEQKNFAVVQTAIYFPLILVNEDALMRYLSDEVIFDKIFCVDRSYLVTDYIDQDESYRKRLRDSMQDLKDFCEVYHHNNKYSR